MFNSADILVPESFFDFGPGDVFFGGEKNLVHLSPFIIRELPVGFLEWSFVEQWAEGNNYEFSSERKSNLSPSLARCVNWYDAVKWCNAKSEMEGLVPCYKVQGIVFRKGEKDAVVCDWSVRGYRLPTEAEWEKAASSSHIQGVRFNNRSLGERLHE